MSMSVLTVRPRDAHPSRITLGPARADLVVARQEPRTSTHIAADRDQAIAEREALEASRPDVMLNGSAEEVASLDHRIAVAKIRIDQAEVQHAAAVKAELAEQAASDAEQSRRKALRKQAMKASGEVAKLADDYVSAARKLAALLGEIREREQLIEQANRSLPVGADPVPPGEPFNGTHGTATRYDTVEDLVWIDSRTGERAGVTNDAVRKHLVAKRVPRRVYEPGTPGQPHIPLSCRVHLPDLGRDATPIW